MYLIRVGELSLKGRNRSYFERTLKNNILAGRKGWKVRGRAGRFFLETGDDNPAEAEEVLSRTFGIKGYARAYKEKKTLEAMLRRAAALYGEGSSDGRASFKVIPRRPDKEFPMSSYEAACALGDHILREFPGSRVDLHNPEVAIHLEIRHDAAYLYSRDRRGPGGLPVGTAGKGLLLLSGGIDSPVAGYMMAKRGLAVDGVYYHTYPYTSSESMEKVRRLAEILSPRVCGTTLYTVNFTPAQHRIAERAAEPEYTLLLRACMMKTAGIIAGILGAGCLVTGESLSQVASQTLESLAFTNSFSDLPVFRPLIGLDKEEIMDIARDIGTYETSILPYPDCCTLFAPEHPLIHPVIRRLTESFDNLDIDEILKEAAGSAEKISFKP